MEEREGGEVEEGEGKVKEGGGNVEEGGKTGRQGCAYSDWVVSRGTGCPLWASWT